MSPRSFRGALYFNRLKLKNIQLIDIYGDGGSNWWCDVTCETSNGTVTFGIAENAPVSTHVEAIESAIKLVAQSMASPAPNEYNEQIDKLEKSGVDLNKLDILRVDTGNESVFLPFNNEELDDRLFDIFENQIWDGVSEPSGYLDHAILQVCSVAASNKLPSYDECKSDNERNDNLEYRCSLAFLIVNGIQNINADMNPLLSNTTH
jgi:hypothetical protein